VDWTNNEKDTKSNMGYVFLLSDGVASWSSKRQSTISFYTIEAEYMATNHYAGK
jgi:hypothetical protein